MHHHEQEIVWGNVFLAASMGLSTDRFKQTPAQNKEESRRETGMKDTQISQLKEINQAADEIMNGRFNVLELSNSPSRQAAEQALLAITAIEVVLSTTDKACQLAGITDLNQHRLGNAAATRIRQSVNQRVSKLRCNEEAAYNVREQEIDLLIDLARMALGRAESYHAQAERLGVGLADESVPCDCDHDDN